MSLTRLDLPDPLTPVTAVIDPEREAHGDVLQVVRLRTVHRELPDRVDPAPLDGRLDRAPTGQVVAGDRLVVVEQRLRTNRSGRPARPCSPAPGPMSTIQSAVRMVSSSCSTTMRVLPRFLSLISVSMSRRLSRWWRPMLGSSSTYSTPGQAGTDLGRQPDALRLAAGQRRRRPREVEVAQADLDEELQTEPDLAQHLSGDLGLALVELHARHEVGTPRRG